MDIGINIAKGVRVRVGDTIEDLKLSLDKNKVAYEIPYQGEVQGGKVDMIMFLEHCGVELKIVDSKLTLIKTNNGEFNLIMQISAGMNPVDALKTIKGNLAEAFSIKPSDIRIDRFDGKTLNSALSIPMNNRDKVKLELVMGIHQQVFLHSIELTS